MLVIYLSRYEFLQGTYTPAVNDPVKFAASVTLRAYIRAMSWLKCKDPDQLNPLFSKAIQL